MKPFSIIAAFLSATDLKHLPNHPPSLRQRSMISELSVTRLPLDKPKYSRLHALPEKSNNYFGREDRFPNGGASRVFVNYLLGYKFILIHLAKVLSKFDPNASLEDCDDEVYYFRNGPDYDYLDPQNEINEIAEALLGELDSELDTVIKCGLDELLILMSEYFDDPNNHDILDQYRDKPQVLLASYSFSDEDEPYTDSGVLNHLNRLVRNGEFEGLIKLHT